MSAAPINGHVATVRSKGAVVGCQARLGAGGPGATAYFSVSKLGSEKKAQHAARAWVRDKGGVIRSLRGGSRVGRLQQRSKTQQAGIRFEWHPYYGSFALHVWASWTGKRGELRSTHYSTQRHGLDGALDLAIAARMSNGAPIPDRLALLHRLQQAYTQGPQE